MDQYISLGHFDAVELSSLSIPLSPYLCHSAASHPDTWTVCRPAGKLCLDYNVLLQVQIQKKMVFGKLAWADTQITKMLFGWLHERMQPVQHVRLTCGALTLQLHPPSAGPDWPGMLKTSASMEPASNRIFVPPMQDTVAEAGYQSCFCTRIYACASACTTGAMNQTHRICSEEETQSLLKIAPIYRGGWDS